MTKHAGRTIEVDSVAELDRLVRAGAVRMRGWLLQDLDLRGRTETLLRLRPAGALLLGCALEQAAIVHLRTGGALLFPSIPQLPFDAYRSTLYTPEELYAGVPDSTYNDTPDARIYAWSRQSDGDLVYPLARALHDHAIDQALADSLRGRHVVGVMGGHDLPRDHAQYEAAARLGRELTTAGAFVATGGGPGAMEAVNLGASLAGYDEQAVHEALATLSREPRYVPSIGRWAAAAFDVRRAWPGIADSIGIPTWFYGHEPPNAFASHIAKYFQNSLREDTLLRNCTGGIVFLPGAAGTVQEIFQDACENYYAEEGAVAPMVLVGARHWTEDVPAWPLLHRLARDRPMEGHVHLVDSVTDVPAVLAQHRPITGAATLEG